jgi:hypothetical protein
MSRASEVVQRIDWALLREQKDYCLNEAANNAEVGHIYMGIVHLMDCLQDAAAADNPHLESQIFGEPL